MRSLALTLVMGATLCGCSISADRKPHATINDVTVKAELDSGYRLIAVDGAPVERAQGHVATVVPFAIVKPGHRTLTLEDKGDPRMEHVTISADLEEGKRYRFAVHEGDVVVVEETD